MLFAPVRSMIASFEPRASGLPGAERGASLEDGQSLGLGASEGSGPFAPACAPAGAPLAALAGGALARRFYRWRGRSGARYVVTVHPLASEDWLEIEGAVVLIVEVDLDGRRRLVAIEADPSAARRRQAFRAASRGGRGGVRFEVHLHLLADTPAARARVGADLAATIAR